MNFDLLKAPSSSEQRVFLKKKKSSAFKSEGNKHGSLLVTAYVFVFVLLIYIL
jgi:hypothetical protein